MCETQSKIKFTSRKDIRGICLIFSYDFSDSNETKHFRVIHLIFSSVKSDQIDN